MKEEKRHWLGLHRAAGVGGATIRAIVEKWGSPGTIIERPRLLAELGARESQITGIQNIDWQQVDKDLAWLEQANHHLLTLTDPRYPDRLRQISDAPPLLFVVGQLETLLTPQIAMVGSRNPSATGTQIAFDFARDLASRGITITSGLALGIDGESHRGALEGKGLTVAVIGTGCDRVYPSRHKKLAHQIVENGGAIVSEYPLGTPALKENFPRRNRIISGLSLGTLVVEAAKQSGSLITARMAGEQGREVFAIPGSIHNPMARGCHELIRQGAKLVETTQDILEELQIQLPVSDTGESKYSNELQSQPCLDQEYISVLNCLGFEPTSIDTVVERSGLTPEAVSSMLLVLELQGLVKLQTGGFYSRIK